MDNITHSLVAAVIGIRLAQKRKHITSAIVLASLLANNFPDSDMLYASLLSQPFGYLLHHRGHTHTLLGAIGCGLIGWLIIHLIFLFIKKPLSKTDTLFVGLVSIIGSFVHIGLDFLNTYGVHPFWPFNNDWYYGDSLFIIEPTLWISLSLAVYPYATKNILKFIALLPTLLGVGLILFSGKVPIILATILVLIFAFIFLTSKNKIINEKSNIWIIVSLIILTSFIIGGRIAKDKIQTTGKEYVQFVIPTPSNPFCWSYLQVTHENNFIKYKRGLISLLPEYLNLKCEKYSLYQTVDNNNFYLKTPYSFIDEEKNNCRWKAFLQFSRVPSIIECGNKKCMTDQRFNRSGENNFSTFTLDGACPDYLPPWNKIINFEDIKK